jgi:hypothetical protein
MYNKDLSMSNRYHSDHAATTPESEAELLAGLARLVGDGKISDSEANRIRGDYESKHMTSDQLLAYIRQKLR